jgi:D-alanine-D-alanine ligase
MGGRSGEHSISLRSAATVVAALGQAGHRLTTVGITRDGTWLLGDFRRLLERAADELVDVPADGRAIAVTLGFDGSHGRLVPLDGRGAAAVDAKVDVVFPVLHGPGGEDGKIQGLCELARLPFVGAGCTASALAMDKLAMKLACAGAGLPQVDFLAVGEGDSGELARRIEAAFGFPCFVKPANLGSSVGISRVKAAGELSAALEEARRWDARVIVERAVDAREIEIALLGNESPELSPPGEIAAPGGFYDFASKYLDGSGQPAELIAPADVPAAALAEIHEVAVAAWHLIGCRGMARVDFFLERSSGRVLLNELNTVPGFTEISMYPRLWRAAGLDTARLVDRLLDLALARNLP